jgi:hypothetical protein
MPTPFNVRQSSDARLEGQNLSIAGYPGTLRRAANFRMVADSGLVHSVKVAYNALSVEVYSAAGSSGSPLYCRNQGGTYDICGIHTKGDPAQDNPAKVAVLITPDVVNFLSGRLAAPPPPARENRRADARFRLEWLRDRHASMRRPAPEPMGALRAGMLRSTPSLSQANVLGQGFDAYGAYDTKSLLRPLVDPSLATGTSTFTFLDKDYLVPSYVIAFQDTEVYYDGGTFESRDSFQNSLAAHAGASLDCGVFSGEMSADYGSVSEQSSEYAYGYKKLFSPLANLKLVDVSACLEKGFAARVAALPDTASSATLGELNAFFNDYGVYYVQSVALGARLEFYVAVRQSSGLSRETIDLMMTAQYDGLFTSGSIDASIKSSQEWKTFSASSTAAIRGKGGDPTKLAAVLATDPRNPSAASVEAFNAWIESLATNPAVIDFTLRGIWELCGSKREVVEEAWKFYAAQMRPRLVIETSSTALEWPVTGAAITVPQLSLGQPLPRPKVAPTSPAGFQILVVDSGAITSPDAILWNQYYCLPADTKAWWAPGGLSFLDQLAHDLSANKLTEDGNLLILVSFGIDGNMFPTDALYELLRSSGGGDQLIAWKHAASTGNAAGVSPLTTSWVLIPSTFVLVGFCGAGPDTGVDSFCYALTPQRKIDTIVEVLFHKDDITGTYAASIGTVTTSLS